MSINRDTPIQRNHPRVGRAIVGGPRLLAGLNNWKMVMTNDDYPGGDAGQDRRDRCGIAASGTGHAEILFDEMDR